MALPDAPDKRTRRQTPSGRRSRTCGDGLKTNLLPLAGRPLAKNRHAAEAVHLPLENTVLLVNSQ